MSEENTESSIIGTEDREQEVADYLGDNPEFFERHLGLLRDLKIPHPTDDRAVSLMERQVLTLRDQVERYRGQLEDLIEVARENERLNRRLHELTLALIETGTLDEVLNTLQDELRAQFDADAVELRLFSASDLDQAVNEGEPGPDMFRDFMEQGKPKCGELQQEQLAYLFGSQANETGSVALVPITGERTLGILAIGSRDASRFHSGKGTEFLRRLGDVVGRTLQVMTEPGV
jgi:uncharacterized protein YigA (DUF484 family)